MTPDGASPEEEPEEESATGQDEREDDVTQETDSIDPEEITDTGNIACPWIMAHLLYPYRRPSFRTNSAN